MSTVAQVFSSKRLWAWFDDTVTQSFDGNVEKGQDYSTTFGTPIGVPVGGRVVRIVGHTNSIGDIVELQDSTGAVWLYQHITARVKIGDVLQCGSVVGTENGLPPDQYSTGAHIEVRYCPPGKWNPGIDSWYEPWLDPKTIFMSIGGQQAGTVASGGFSGFSSFFGGTGGGTGGGPPLVQHLQPNDSVKIALVVMDETLAITNPFVVSDPQQDTFSALGVSLSFTDPIMYIQDVAENFAKNISAFALRVIIGGLGVFLLYKVSSTWIDYGAIAQTATGIAQTAVKGAVMLA